MLPPSNVPLTHLWFWHNITSRYCRCARSYWRRHRHPQLSHLGIWASSWIRQHVLVGMCGRIFVPNDTAIGHATRSPQLNQIPWEFSSSFYFAFWQVNLKQQRTSHCQWCQHHHRFVVWCLSTSMATIHDGVAWACHISWAFDGRNHPGKNTVYQYTLSVNPIDTPYSYTLSANTHLIISIFPHITSLLLPSSTSTCW